MINKHAKKEVIAEPRKEYSFRELSDFHDSIQKFWVGEPRHVELPNGMSGPAQKFDWEEMAVDYGAAKKVKHGEGKFVYLYNYKYHELCNLWGQYEEWRKKQDWITEKNLEALAQTAEVAF